MILLIENIKNKPRNYQDSFYLSANLDNIGAKYSDKGMHDSALYFLNMANEVETKLYGGINSSEFIGLFRDIAVEYEIKGDLKLAKYYYDKSIAIFETINKMEQIDQAKILYDYSIYDELVNNNTDALTLSIQYDNFLIAKTNEIYYFLSEDEQFHYLNDIFSQP